MNLHLHKNYYFVHVSYSRIVASVLPVINYGVLVFVKVHMLLVCYSLPYAQTAVCLLL